jgi:CheY-like chemotaxis protein
VREIVRQANGFIAVASTLGTGTCFEIYLPRLNGGPRPPVPTELSQEVPSPNGPPTRELPPEQRSPEAGLPNETSPRSPRRQFSRAAMPVEAGSTAPDRTVLLVEDDELISRVATRIFHRAGWTVLCADSAEAALEVLETSTCGLMVSDVAMPGMDGLALARIVLARQPDCPVILTSAYEPGADDGFGAARVTYLSKPYGQADLLEAVARIVAMPRRQPAPPPSRCDTP